VPALGLAALAWHDRWHLVQEDVRLFFRVLGRREHAERLARDRAALTAEFDALAAEVDALQGGDGPLPGATRDAGAATPA
jgi:hypothetical protein